MTGPPGASGPPAGWYPDPYGMPGLLRWWDGGQWTTDTAPHPAAQAQPVAPPTEHAEPTAGSTPPAAERTPAGGPPWASFDDVEATQEWRIHPLGDDATPAAYLGPDAGPDASTHTGTHTGADWVAGQHRAPSGSWTGTAPSTGSPPFGTPRDDSAYAPSRRAPRRRRNGWLIGGVAGGVALVLVVVVVVVVVSLASGSRGETAGPPVGGPPGTSAPASPNPPASPRVSAGGISYARLPAPWLPSDAAAVTEFASKSGQIRFTQRKAPGVHGGWIANVTIGDLSNQFGYRGPQDLESAADALAGSVQDHYYEPWKLHRTELGHKRISVSGRPGYQVRFHLDFLDTPKGFAAKGETVLVAVIDHQPQPYAVYISIPDNAHKLQPAFGLVMGSLQVR